MPRLVLLNGPPGIGKSTLSRRYVGEHPGVLDLDVDRLRSFIGGWREDFGGTGEVVRLLALALVTAHLQGGRDVVMPQFLARVSEVERFEAATRAGGGEFVHVVLLDDEDRSVARFARRSGDDEDWHHFVRGFVEEAGGETHLRAMHATLLELLRERPEAVVVPSTEGDLDATYDGLLRVLEEA